MVVVPSSDDVVLSVSPKPVDRISWWMSFAALSGVVALALLHRLRRRSAAVSTDEHSDDPALG
jgi:hypothetical protein